MSDYLNAQEYASQGCQNYGGKGGCWAQIGWTVGQLHECNGDITTGSTVDVYVELYDDTGPWPAQACYVATEGAAPSYAAYDVRYTSTVQGYLGKTQYRYDTYYEAPNSGNIQDLAYGYYNSKTTQAVASGEAYVYQAGQGFPYCPVLGQTPSGHWNTLGTNDGGTFATYLNVYVGYWASWTSSYPTSQIVNDPYQTNPTPVTDYSHFQNGGPHA